MGILGKNRVYIRPEESGGAATLGATIGWRGTGAIKDDSETKTPEERIGQPIAAIRPYIAQYRASCAFPSIAANYEQLMYILDAGVQGGVGVADGVGSGFIHTFDYLAATPSIRTYRLYTGDDTQAYMMKYGFVESFSLSAQADDAVMVDAKWIGRMKEKTTFPTPPTYQEVETIIGSSGGFYIDDNDGTIGTTAVSGTLLKWSLSVTTGWKPKFTVDDGQLYFNYAYFDSKSWKAELSLTYEHDATGVSEDDKRQAKAIRLIRLKLPGGALTTPATETIKTLWIDCAGYYTNFSEVKDQEGNNIVEASLSIGADSLSGEGLNFRLVNELQRTNSFS